MSIVNWQHNKKQKIGSSNKLSGAVSNPAINSTIAGQIKGHDHLLVDDADDEVSLPSSSFVKALFDFRPSHEIAIPAPGVDFDRGTILYLVNAADAQWWRARRVLDDGQLEQVVGLIPSKQRVEAREMRRRRHVQFNPATLKQTKSLQPTTPLEFIKRWTRNDSNSGKTEKNGDKNSNNGNRRSKEKNKMQNKFLSVDCLSDDAAFPSISSYIPVRPVSASSGGVVRPVILVGALTERIKDDILWLHKHRFINFNTDVHQNQALVHRLIHDAKSQTKRMSQKKHPILDVELVDSDYLALYDEQIVPFTMFIRPRHCEQLMEWNRRLSDAAAQTEIEGLNELESRITRHITHVLSGDTPEEIGRAVAQLVQDQCDATVWIPNASASAMAISKS